MDISDDKMNVYKDLARKCESFELFKWIVGDKESWMTEAGKAETETMLKTIYNGVHITDSRYALEEKNAWLDKYLPELPREKRLFVPCGTDKSVAVPGLIRPDDYLLDDYTKNLSEWEPPARGIKLINGINHTNGTWQGDKIQFTHAPEELSSMISDVMKGWTHFYEDRIVTDSVTMHSTKNDNRSEYDIEITEVLQKVVSTKAASLQEAIQDVEEQYHNSEIILDADDLKETTIEAAHPQLDEEITTDLRGIFL